MATDPKNSQQSATSSALQWSQEDVQKWLVEQIGASSSIKKCFQKEGVDGEILLMLSESDIRDLRLKFNYSIPFGEMKKLWQGIKKLKNDHAITQRPLKHPSCYDSEQSSANSQEELLHRRKRSPRRVRSVPPDYFRTAVSVVYSLIVTWINSLVMVIVHERVPDMDRYPPLPDFVLDNLPHIPWAFHMCEITVSILFVIWAIVFILHKHRTILLRRFSAIAGSVFLLRCCTMFITSLSVPGTHLKCNRNDFSIDYTDLTFWQCLSKRMSRAFYIWKGLGLSIKGVHTCGDYIFSGHTVALTLMNFFITEYTPRDIYFLHTMCWLMNIIGIFFIMAAHEHYSIDVFIAFYITSRLVLYYHTLANNHALMSHDSVRTRIWYPLFSYFEQSIQGPVPNEYDSISELFHKLRGAVLSVKDFFLNQVRRLWNRILPRRRFDGNSNVLQHNEDISRHPIVNGPEDIFLTPSQSYQSEVDLQGGNESESQAAENESEEKLKKVN